jgi:2',3'-cyclic-nucleotide 2'-phosphodiesterase (5'-nucleotidase family)
LVLDAGEAFGPSSESGKRMAAVMIDAMAAIGYDAMNLGQRELAYDEGFLSSLGRKAPFPLLNCNSPLSEKKPFQPYVVRKVGNLRIGIMGLARSYEPPSQESHTPRLDDPNAAAARLVPILRQKADLVVVLAAIGDLDADTLIARVPGIDILIEARNPYGLPQPKKRGQTIVVSPGDRGQNLGELKLTLGPDRKISAHEGKLIALAPGVPEDSTVLAMVRRHKEDEESRTREEARAREAAKPERAYATVSKCAECHRDQYDSWALTKHASALNTILVENKQGDKNCLSCHTTAFGRPGGFVDLESTLDLESVQCEACHGAGAVHASNPKQGGLLVVNEWTCRACHTKEWSPKFDYASYSQRGVHTHRSKEAGE